MKNMATWRRKAIELFPDLKNALQDKEYSSYSLFGELLNKARLAYKLADQDALKKIFGFTEWCFRQKNKDLWNAAGVSFYEHLNNITNDWRFFIPWLSFYVVERCEDLWKEWLKRDEFIELKKMTMQNKIRPTKIMRSK